MQSCTLKISRTCSMGLKTGEQEDQGEIMMGNNSSLPLFTARDAKAKFGEVLDTALGRPVGITKHDRLTAYIVSKNEFETLVSTIQNLEDQLWLLKADAARAEGFASPDEVSAFLHNFGNTDNEPENDKTGPEVRKGAR